MRIMQKTIKTGVLYGGLNFTTTCLRMLLVAFFYSTFYCTFVLTKEVRANMHCIEA